MIHRHQQRDDIPRAIRVSHNNAGLGKGTRSWVQRCGDGDLIGVGIHLGFPPRVDVLLIQLDLSFKAAVLAPLHQVRNLVPGFLKRDYLAFLSGFVVFHAGNYCLLVGVILRVVELGVVEAPLVVSNNVCLVVAIQRVRAFKRSAYTAIVVFNRSLKLVDAARLGEHAEAHALLVAQVRALVLRHGVEDLAGSLINTYARLTTTRSVGVTRADEVTLRVVSLHDHAGHGIVRAAVLHLGNVDLADFELLAWLNDQLFSVLPRHRDRVTFDVLARPRVYSSAKNSAAPLGGIRPVRIVLRVVALPGVTHRVITRGRSELLDFLIGQLCVDIQVP